MILLEWKDKIDGIDDVLAEDINAIANAVIELQEDLENLETPNIDLNNYYTKEEIDNKIGDIETALDSIIAIQERTIALQESLIGGDVE